MVGPRLTGTHSTFPSLIRITNVCSVVVTTLVGGTNSEDRGFRTGQRTSGYIPGANLRSGFFTSSSTAIVLVLSSSECATRAMAPRKISPGYAGTVNEA